MKVRYYGHIGIGTGYSVAAEQTCKAMLAVGIELDIRPIGAVGGYASPEVTKHLLRNDPDPDVIVVHTLPADCRRVLDIEQIIDANQAVVAHTTWEGISPIPDVITHSMLRFNQVWVPSEVTSLTFTPVIERGLGIIDVEVIPHAFDASKRSGKYEPRGMRDRYTFYYVGAWTGRKNPAGVLRAYTHAFSKADDVNLTIVSKVSKEILLAQLASSGLPQDAIPSITLINDHISDEDLADIHRRSDCYVTATRGESWNLPAFDAMLARRHIITPDLIGSDEFLRGDTSMSPKTTAHFIRGYDCPAQVDVRVGEYENGGLRMQTVGVQGLTSKTLWREPDLVDLASKMRDAFVSRTRDLGLRYDPNETYGYKAVGKTILKALELL